MSCGASTPISGVAAAASRRGWNGSPKRKSRSGLRTANHAVAQCRKARLWFVAKPSGLGLWCWTSSKFAPAGLGRSASGRLWVRTTRAMAGFPRPASWARSAAARLRCPCDTTDTVIVCLAVVLGEGMRGWAGGCQRWARNSDLRRVNAWLAVRRRMACLAIWPSGFISLS